jgi:hypothetical protein
VFRDEENFSHILSHKAIKLIKEVPLLQVFGVTNFFLRFTTETKEETKRILEEFKRTYS